MIALPAERFISRIRNEKWRRRIVLGSSIINQSYCRQSYRVATAVAVFLLVPWILN
jgi:hypothetical protein